MGTTITFDDDTAAAIERLRREKGLGVSEAVNEPVRRGLLPDTDMGRFVQKTHRLGAKIDVSNVGDALEY